MQVVAKLSTLTAVILSLAGAVAHAAGGGGGGGGGKLQIATVYGITVIEQPAAGEPSMTGYVHVVLAGDQSTPIDTVVTLNGVTLVHAPGLTPAYFQLDPAGPQPTAGLDRFLHITASSVSTNTSRTLNQPCPAHIPVATSPVEDANLAGVSTLIPSWGTPLPQNVISVLTFFDSASATLSSYDLKAGAVDGRHFVR